MSDQFLILAYPRSATNFTMQVLNNSGLFVSHEKDQRYLERICGTRKELDGVVTGVFRKCKPTFKKYKPILHQVRHPLAVISSCLQKSISDRNLLSIYRAFGQEKDALDPGEKLLNIMKTWLLFTEHADRMCRFRYPIEKILSFWKRIKYAVDIKQGVEFPRKLKWDMNSFRGRGENLTWEDLSVVDKETAILIRERAFCYGYGE